MFSSLPTLSMEFFGRRSAGDIVNCFSADTEKLENSLDYGMPLI
jgi:ATP-binding cassette subfamily B protein